MRGLLWWWLVFPGMDLEAAVVVVVVGFPIVGESEREGGR